MIRINEVKQSLDATKEDLFKACKKILRIDDEQIKSITIARQSVDSRKKKMSFLSTVWMLRFTVMKKKSSNARIQTR